MYIMIFMTFSILSHIQSNLLRPLEIMLAHLIRMNQPMLDEVIIVEFAHTKKFSNHKVYP